VARRKVIWKHEGWEGELFRGGSYFRIKRVVIKSLESQEEGIKEGGGETMTLRFFGHAKRRMDSGKPAMDRVRKKK